MQQASATLSTETVEFSRSVENMEGGVVHTVRNAVDTLGAVHQDVTAHAWSAPASPPPTRSASR